MKTSVISRLTPSNTGRERPGCKGGFTLLELLVVLTLMAAMTGLALPQMVKMYDSGQRAFERRQVLDDIAALPYVAFQNQQGFSIASATGEPASIPLVLPPGWSVKALQGQDIVYRSNGMCSGGTLLLSHNGLVERLQLVAPLCSPFRS